MDENTKKIGFYFQVWYTDKRSIFESIKRFRKVYPDELLFITFAGISNSELQIYNIEFADVLKKIFDVTNFSYMTIEEYPEMKKYVVDCNKVNKNYRDTWYDFSEAWIDKMISVVGKSNIDILFACTDDCMIMEKIPINYNAEFCGMITDCSDWMNIEKMKNIFNKDILFKNFFVWWPANFFYMDYNKFLNGYTKTNKDFIKKFINETYSERLGMFTDFICGLWGIFLFDKIEEQNYCSHYDCTLHVVSKYGGTLPGDEQWIDEYPEDIYKKDRYVVIHSYKTFRNVPISDEMKNIGFK